MLKPRSRDWYWQNAKVLENIGLGCSLVTALILTMSMNQIPIRFPQIIHPVQVSRDLMFLSALYHLGKVIIRAGVYRGTAIATFLVLALFLVGKYQQNIGFSCLEIIIFGVGFLSGMFFLVMTGRGKEHPSPIFGAKSKRHS